MNHISWGAATSRNAKVVQSCRGLPHTLKHFLRDEASFAHPLCRVLVRRPARQIAAEQFDIALPLGIAISRRVTKLGEWLCSSMNSDLNMSLRFSMLQPKRSGQIN